MLLMYHALQELFPGAAVREWITSAKEGWVAMNPSIAFSPVEGYRAILRTVNYRMNSEGQYLMPYDGVIRTRNLFATLDGSLNIADVDYIDEAGGWGPVEYPLVRGLEDARLAWDDGRWSVYGTLRERFYSGICRIAEADLDGYRMVNHRMPETPDRERNEKNWMRLGSDYIYTCNPPACWRRGPQYIDTDHELVLPPETEDFRGSSQAIRWSHGWLAVIHTVDWSTGYRQYFHRFCAFDDDGYLTGYTAPFWFHGEPGIEFAAGLVDWKDSYAVSFGHRDEQCMLATIPKEEVHSQLIGVST